MEHDDGFECYDPYEAEWERQFYENMDDEIDKTRLEPKPEQ